MQTGTPSITTNIGAEAMNDNLLWGGAICDNLTEFVSTAARLYADREKWLQAQQNGLRILNDKYDKGLFIPGFMEKIQYLKGNLSQHRRKNFMGQILQHHSLNSNKYMSLWISEKNKLR